MSLSFVLYALAVAGLVSAAAVLTELSLESIRRPSRWVWLAAAIITLAITGLGLLPEGMLATGELVATSASPAGASGAAVIPPPAPITVSTGPASVWAVARPWLPWALGGISLIGGAFLVGGWTRLRRGRSAWASARVGETDVRVTDDFGPAVVGVIRPEIVLPRSVLDLDAEQLSMILRHEDEHRCAGDPALLLAGACLLCVMPWNPLLWFQFRRLRRAIELDCDSRVLGSGVSAARYGRLLLTLQGAPQRYVLATMLQEPASFLERRLMMMKQRLEVRKPVRAVALAGVAVTLMVAACETPNPTAVQVEPTGEFVVTEVSTAGQLSAPEVSVIRGAIHEIELEDVATLWQYRGRLYDEVPVETDVSAVRGLVPFLHPDREVVVYQLSEANLEGVWKAPSGGIVREGLWLPGEGHEIPTAEVVEKRGTIAPRGEIKSRQAPLVVVDGVITDGALADVSSLDIESIELMKGAQAVEVYGTRGRNGVVMITTKAGSRAETEARGGVFEFEARPLTYDSVRIHEEALAGMHEASIRLRAVYESAEIPAGAVGTLTRRPSNEFASTAPLVVVDGVITDLTLDDVDRETVASIEVVKGSAAAAIYGTRAQNGVVVVTTRR